MNIQKYSVEIAAGVHYTEVIDPRQRTCLLELHFLCPHTRERAPYHALLCGLLTDSCAEHPKSTEMHRILEHLYASELTADVSKIGEAADLRIAACWLDDWFTPDRENITGQMMHLLYACLTAPNLQTDTQGTAFEQACFENAKQNLLHDMDSKQADPLSYTANRAAELTFPDAPAALSAFGLKADAEKADPQTCYAVWREICRTAPAEVIAVLPGESPMVQETLQDIFRTLAAQCGRAPLMPKTGTRPQENAQPVHKRETRSIAQSYLVQTYGFRGEECPDADTVYLMCEILGGESESLLFQELREKAGLCYSCDAVYSRATGTVWVSTAAEPENIPQVQAGIAEQLRRLRTGDFPADALHNAKTSLIYGLSEDADSAEGQADQLFHTLLYDDRRDYAARLADIEKITLAAVIAAAERLCLHTEYLADPEN